MRKTREQVAVFMRAHLELLGYNRIDKRYFLLCSCGKTVRKRRQQIEVGLVQCQSCNSKVWADRNRRQLAPHVSLFNALKWRATHRNISCTLTLNEFVALTMGLVCEYCGTVVVWSLKGGSIPIDRKDNNLGYTKKNCVICCGECNRIKSNRYTYSQMCIIGNVLQALRKREKVAA